MHRLRTLALAAGIGGISVLGLAPPAEAANVKVTFSAIPIKSAVACKVSVPQGADGIAVLNAARAKGCIQSYRLLTFPIGSFVDCINTYCTKDVGKLGLVFLSWSMRENGRATSYGVDGFRADQGDKLTFIYGDMTWPTCLLPTGCI